jgi:hypothetical protein
MGEIPRKAMQGDAAAARDAIPALRTVLDDWVMQLRGNISI